MAIVKTPKRLKVASAAKPKKKSASKRSNAAARKNLSPEMLDALIRHSPLHAAAVNDSPNKPPFEPQDD